MRWPAQVKAGSKWDQPVCQTDLLATFSEMLEQPLPDAAGEDSFSFFAAMMGQQSESPRTPMIHHSSGGDFAIRDGKWKLVMEGGKQKRALFDIESDPSEKQNVIGQHPEVTKQLVAKITKIIRSGRSTKGEPQANDTGWWQNLTWMEKW